MRINKKYVAATAAVAIGGAVMLAIGAPSMDFVPNDQPVGYVAQPVPSSFSVASGTARMYSSDYNSNKWTGNVHAFAISDAGVIGSSDTWGAGGAEFQIAQQSKADKGKGDRARKIVTFNGTSGVGFEWSELTTAQKTDIDAANVSSTGSPAMLEYLRGSKANEGGEPGQFRPREGGMGDIIHSTPVYLSTDKGDSKPAERTVFVGANDGMMHAIDADNGTERFAFIPNTVIPNLKHLASQTYSHRYFVDGRLDLRQFDNTTMLVGLLGAGGAGLYGIDVSDLDKTQSQAQFASKVKWEINNKKAGFENLGYTYGAPTMFNLDASTPALVVGNGYNNTGSKKASLFIINPVTGAKIAELETSDAGPNGLSSPSIWDADGDGFQETVFAGDLKGNLWKFSLKKPYATASTVTKLHSGANFNSAITMAPAVMFHPIKGAMVTFVSGRMLNAEDGLDTTTHYAYGIWDEGPATGTLLTQTLTETTFGTDLKIRTATDNKPDWTKHRGWKTALPVTGERVVGDGAFILNGVFQFFSTNPTTFTSAVPPGENWWMQLSGLTGGALNKTVFDLNNDRKFDSSDDLKVRVDGKDTYVAAVGRHMGGGVRSQLIGLTAGGIDIYHSNFDRNGAPRPTTTTTETETHDGQRGVNGGHFDTDVFCFDNCGRYNNAYAYYGTVTPDDGSGWYGKGRESSTSDTPTEGIKYVHVHEYDDMYDKLGQSYTHPSQDLQRLRLVKEYTRTTDSPNFAELESTKSIPSDGVDQSVDDWDEYDSTGYSKAPNVPATTFDYEQGPLGRYGSKVVAENATEKTSSQTARYVATRTKVEYRNAYNSSNKKYYRQKKTTTSQWYTYRTLAQVWPNFEFKVLIANQAYSPAVNFKIYDKTNPKGAAANYDGKVIDYQTKATLDVLALPSYKVADVGKEPAGTNPPDGDLKVSMPLDAFNVKDWSGKGDARVGLHPISPTCVGVSVSKPTPGPAGEWRNGALTVQIVDPSINANDVVMNVANRPELGYRLADGSVKGKLIAEYLIYWHHSTNGCMISPQWSKTPAKDPSTHNTDEGIPAARERDPKGEFVASEGSDPQPPADPAPVVTTNADGSVTTVTVTYTKLSSGGYVKKTTTTTVPATLPNGTGVVTGGAVNGVGVIDSGGVARSQTALGRINWRELRK